MLRKDFSCYIAESGPYGNVLRRNVVILDYGNVLCTTVVHVLENFLDFLLLAEEYVVMLSNCGWNFASKYHVYGELSSRYVVVLHEGEIRIFRYRREGFARFRR